MWHALLDLFFPRRSITGGEGEWVTAEEIASMRTCPIILPQSELRMLGIQWLDRVTAASAFDRPILRRAIHTFKYRRIPGVAVALGEVLADTSRCITLESGLPVLCPVPLHWTRKFARGFNQSELLARHVARHRIWECRSLLRRTRATGAQAQRNREQRLQAMTKAFAIRMPIPHRVLLIDDVFTTGTTLDACAGALKAGGAQIVEALVLGRG